MRLYVRPETESRRPDTHNAVSRTTNRNDNRTETLARKLKMSVAYMDMYKLSRGHYKVRMRMIAERPEELPSMELTERYAMLLEQTIQRNPAIWLWSHKRWKYPVTLPPDYDLTHPQK